MFFSLQEVEQHKRHSVFDRFAVNQVAASMQITSALLSSNYSVERECTQRRQGARLELSFRYGVGLGASSAALRASNAVLSLDKNYTPVHLVGAV
jgi:hypothetical protein